MRKFLLVLCLLVMAACEKAPINPIPYARVYLELNVMFQDKDLNGLFTYKSFTIPRTASDYLGFGGILVTHGLSDEYFAYDLACPNEVSPAIRIEVTADGLNAKCPKCGSVYDIMGGGARISGPSPYNLKRYRISFTGEDQLLVSN